MAKEEDKKAENEDTPIEEKPKGGSKKLLVIGLLLGLLLGGGGGFGAFMMLSGSDAPAEQVEEVIVKEEEPKIDAQFVKVERVNIPLVSNGRVVGNLLADFSIKVDGDDNKMEVIVNMPEIRDAILRHFSGKSIGKKDNPRSIDYPMLKSAIKDISNKILEKPLVLDVMVVQVKQF